ncbi:putative glycosidase CRH2 [Coemansia sp. RSA 1813]|nr:putative glycosidase CRH2 [Coemansia sp. RSA 1646]KAJ1773740.1 putative glycosidase CRH2 [Coemansia sp. RSA 1843]KAJ2093701.1 putative glycosidase CRH2 [Coemansia sp. RSA 986]KAJ2217916.1 putative glycosidase CRH2 [Coemansia sp. RSA 487]KAJ2573245.1 putative glycosidase CRH2 [Coemansia sp. RSA 1813]
MNKLFAFYVAASALVIAAMAATTCTEFSPCAREGYCNSNAMFCMWGLCDESKSYNSTSCWQPESCASQSVTFDSSSDAIPINSYDGNPNSAAFVSIFEPNNAAIENGNLVLKMTYDSSQKKGFGTTVENTHTIQYGKVTARIKTASIATGVVSAFIIRSDVVGDEIDFEWVGKDPNQVQTNFFYHDELVYTNSKKHDVGGDSSADYHDYTIVWDADSIVWMLDNKAIRTLNRKDTYDSGSKEYKFPSARSRVGLSIWDGGNSGAKGTEEWAGYPTPWTANTVYKMYVDSISIECSGGDSSASSDGSDETSSSSTSSSSVDNTDNSSTPNVDGESSANENDDSTTGGSDNTSVGGDDNTNSGDGNTGGGDSSTSGGDNNNTSGGENNTGGGNDSTPDSSNTDGNDNTPSSTDNNNGSQPTADTDTEPTNSPSSTAGQKCQIITITKVSQL